MSRPFTVQLVNGKTHVYTDGWEYEVDYELGFLKAEGLRGGVRQKTTYMLAQVLSFGAPA